MTLTSAQFEKITLYHGLLEIVVPVILFSTLGFTLIISLASSILMFFIILPLN